MQDVLPQDEHEPVIHRTGGAALMHELADGRLGRVADVIAGHANEIDEDDVILAVEFDAPLLRSDHMRLLRAASLAIQYYRVNPMGHAEASFIRRVAAVFQVDPEELKAYALVLQREIRHREKTGSSPLSDLPRLIAAEQPAKLDVPEMLTIAPRTRFKHDPSVYVELAEQGLNNTEIANYLGDVSEAAVRRGLASVDYKRSSVASDEADE